MQQTMHGLTFSNGRMLMDDLTLKGKNGNKNTMGHIAQLRNSFRI